MTPIQYLNHFSKLFSCQVIYFEVINVFGYGLKFRIKGHKITSLGLVRQKRISKDNLFVLAHFSDFVLGINFP
jgi:hypothetical protein